MITKSKEAFEYRYTRPCLDWYEYVHVKIEPDDYVCFRLEVRFGLGWWLVGKVYNYGIRRWEEVQIGQIPLNEIKRFIEWAKRYKTNPFSDEQKPWGNSITEIRVISGEIDIFKQIKKIMPNEAGEGRDE